MIETTEPTYTSGDYQRNQGLTGTAIDTYNSHVHAIERRLVQRHDVAKVMHDFTRDKVYHYTEQAAELIDLFDRLNSDDETKNNARRAVKELGHDTTPLGDSGYTHGDYLLAIADDVPVINDFTSSEFDQWHRALLGSDNQFDRDTAAGLNPKDHHDIDAEVWLRDSMPYDDDKLAGLAESISIETILLKSSQILANLRDPDLLGHMTDTDQLRTIMMAESIYQPLCDVVGLDALSSALMDETWQLRLNRAGRHDLVERAVEIRQQAGSVQELENNMPAIIGEICGEFASSPVIRNGATDYNLLFQDGVVVINGTNDHYRITLRLKSVGAIARKLHYFETKPYWHPEIVPSDVLAATIITDEIDQIGPILASIRSRIDNSPSIRPQSAPSRDESIHIKGPAAYKDAVLAGAGITEPDGLVHIEDHDGDYMATKVTVGYIYDPNQQLAGGSGPTLPIEVQVLDPAARTASRSGDDAHFKFKSDKYRRDREAIEGISLDEINRALKTDELNHVKITPIQRILLRKAKLDKDNPGVYSVSIERSRQMNRARDFSIGQAATHWTS